MPRLTSRARITFGHGKTGRYSRPATPFALKPAGPETSDGRPQLLLPDIPGPVHPWTEKEVLNNPENFQIAIVTDRNGGNRPGIFRSAVHKLNHLQPEFVMSIGDFIHGYSTDLPSIKSWWDDFEDAISHLEMPFFYVPGNHDVTNDVEKAEWLRRNGPLYYHFRYGNVLFLCLNTDDEAPGIISANQVEYFRKALDENKDVRWTIVFMHKPLWSGKWGQALGTSKADMKQLKSSRWFDMEQLLSSRPYTVFAGHVHSYTQYTRHNRKYYTLATTGGGSSLEGAKVYGRFDQVVWLTMTNNGPVFANLALDGIMDEDLRVEKETGQYYMAQLAVSPGVAVTDPLPFTSATMTVSLNNVSTRPMNLKLTAPKGAVKFDPPVLTETLAPKQKKTVSFHLNGTRARNEKDTANMFLTWEASYDIQGRPPFTVKGIKLLQLDSKRLVKPAKASVKLDGDLSEWAGLWSPFQRFSEVQGKKHAISSPADISFQYAAQYDADNLYLAFRVKDDDILTTPAKGHPLVDSLKAFLLPAGKTGKQDTIKFVAFPAKSGAGRTHSNQPEVKTACETVKGGYQVEAAIPLAKLGAASADWSSFRLNVQIDDDDNIRDTRRSKQWWMPRWGSRGDYPESGTFLRGN